jgi:hypothetical protein
MDVRIRREEMFEDDKKRPFHYLKPVISRYTLE